MILTVPQTLKLLRISRTTMYRMFDRGELNKIELGRSVRVELPEHLEKKYEKQIRALIN